MLAEAWILPRIYVLGNSNIHIENCGINKELKYEED